MERHIASTKTRNSSSELSDPSDVLNGVEEAECALAVAYAERNVRRAETKLVECRIKFYRVQAVNANRRLKDADRDVGRARCRVSDAHRQAWSSGASKLVQLEPPSSMMTRKRELCIFRSLSTLTQRC